MTLLVFSYENILYETQNNIFDDILCEVCCHLSHGLLALLVILALSLLKDFKFLLLMRLYLLRLLLFLSGGVLSLKPQPNLIGWLITKSELNSPISRCL